MHFVSFETKNKHLIKIKKKKKNLQKNQKKKTIKLLHFNVTGDKNFVDRTIMNFACLVSEKERKKKKINKKIPCKYIINWHKICKMLN